MPEKSDLLARHGAALHRYARALAGDPDFARDLWQETAARVLAARRLPMAAEARVWLFRILRNTFLDAVRHARVVRDHRMEGEAMAGRTQVGDGGALLAEIAIRQALGRLPDAQREVVALVDVAGFSYLEAAETLGVPPGTVMSRLSRARATMLEDLSENRVVPLRRRSV